MSDSGSEARRVRDNGLSAHGYQAVADVDPRLAAHLLDVLLLERIAAYVEPTYDEEPLASRHLPARPLDRLYVDRTRAQDATASVQQATDAFAAPQDKHLLRILNQEPQGSGSGAIDEEPAGTVPDEDWESLVSRLRDATPTTDGDRPAWPDAEGTSPQEPDPPRRPRFRAVEIGGLTFLQPRPRGGDAGDSAAAHAPSHADPESRDESVGPDEGHYVPPAPPELPRLSRVARWGVGAVLFGFALLLIPYLAGWGSSVPRTTLAVCCIAGGAVALLSRVKDGPAQDDGWDDGAVV